MWPSIQKGLSRTREISLARGMSLTRGISLADKCLILFGGAVVLIVVAALMLPWLRMRTLVSESQDDVARHLHEAWRQSAAVTTSPPSHVSDASVTVLERESLEQRATEDRFLRQVVRAFESDPSLVERSGVVTVKGQRKHRYVRVERGEGGAVRSVVMLERPFDAGAWLTTVNTVYLLGAASVVSGLAVVVFWLITHRIILGPVRELRETTERVRLGDLSIRSAIKTGDEFESLSDTFNAMLGELQKSQADLRAVSAAKDVRLTELAEANTALHDAARLKGEFLANVSHELRTPLNSIIGFAELLLEIAHGERPATPEESSRLTKRVKYLTNIVTAARNLLDLINSLLDLAKIEAGRVDLVVTKVSMRDACEALIGLIYPQAERKRISLKLEVAPDIPIVETDIQKFQQIIFNFLSNAVKFTEGADMSGVKGEVILRAERLLGDDEGERVRVSVIDNGPGIDPADHQRIFEKFHQLDSGHTRKHTGAGLGLAISRELAAMLQGEIQVVSDIGRGSMFSLILPLRLDADRIAEAKLEGALRGALAGRRAWEEVS